MSEGFQQGFGVVSEAHSCYTGWIYAQVTQKKNYMATARKRRIAGHSARRRISGITVCRHRNYTHDTRSKHHA